MAESMNKRIRKRTYYEIDIITISPLCIGNGESYETDADVLRNGMGDVFVPGTSLAGAFRNYHEVKKNENGIYGFSKDEDGRMSSLFISDLYFETEGQELSVRDMVSLTEDKSVENKFDGEVLERGAKGKIRIELLEREGDPEDGNAMVEDLICAINEGEIRFGSKKNRGYGRFSVESVSVVSFTEKERQQWIDFLAQNKKTDGTKKSFDEWKKEITTPEKKYIKVRVPLKLTGGISIRRYSTQPGKADYEQLTSKGEPVIPGSSWNGAIRHDARRILRELGMKQEKAEQYIDSWFGNVKTKEDTNARQSMIVISESILKDAVAVPMTRNKINRFTAGTKDGALYTELSYFGGITELEYMLPKEAVEDYRKIIAIMEIVAKDIANGYVAIGGQTAVGRGIFEGRGEPEYSEDVDIDKCMNELYEAVTGGAV